VPFFPKIETCSPMKVYWVWGKTSCFW